MRMTVSENAQPDPTFPPRVWMIHCDGSAVPNPGRMGLGAVVEGPAGTARECLAHATTATGCNNEAELRALLLALRAPRLAALPDAAAQAATLRVCTDSRVLVEQLGPQRAPPIARLEPLFEQARALLRRFGQVQWQWVPRHRNTEADALARAALGLAPKSPALPPGQRRKRKKRR